MKRKLMCLAIVAVILCAMFAFPASAAQCYITKTNVSGTWTEYWYQTTYPSGVIGYFFTATNSSDISNLSANGHHHTGTLSSYSGVNVGTRTGPYVYVSGYYCYKYINSTATYYGYLTCLSY
jgi:hypothetical protein